MYLPEPVPPFGTGTVNGEDGFTEGLGVTGGFNDGRAVGGAGLGFFGPGAACCTDFFGAGVCACCVTCLTIFCKGFCCFGAACLGAGFEACLGAPGAGDGIETFLVGSWWPPAREFISAR